MDKMETLRVIPSKQCFWAYFIMIKSSINVDFHINNRCKGAALFALVNSLLGFGPNPGRHKSLSLENFLSFLSCHLTSMLGIKPKYLALSLSSFGAEIKTVGLFSQLGSPADPPVSQVTHRLPPSPQFTVIEAKIISYTAPGMFLQRFRTIYFRFVNTDTSFQQL